MLPHQPESRASYTQLYHFYHLIHRSKFTTLIMRLLTAFRFGLMPNPTATSTGAAVGEAVEALATRTGMHIAAIIPTTSGQIGVNPVSILPPASVL